MSLDSHLVITQYGISPTIVLPREDEVSLDSHLVITQYGISPTIVLPREDEVSLDSLLVIAWTYWGSLLSPNTTFLCVLFCNLISRDTCKNGHRPSCWLEGGDNNAQNE